MSNKYPLLLISGLLSNQRLWQHQNLHLNDLATIQIISPSQDTPKKMVDEILSQAPSKFSLAGHSMGGWLCLEIMKTAPDRVQKLCLLNTTAGGDSIDKLNNRKNMIKKCEQGLFFEIVKEIAEKFVYNSFVKHDVQNMFLEVGKHIFIQQELAMIKRDETLSILPNITCPTLVVHSMFDKVFSKEEHQELVNLIPNTTLATVENSGHMSPMEAPEAITTLLRTWLENL